MVLRGTIPSVASENKSGKIPVVIISDGKPGHENQSLGIAEQLPNADILLLRHTLKESLFEALLRLQIRFSIGTKSNPEKFLSRIFKAEEIQRIKQHKPKAIISAGTLSAAPCIAVGYLTGAVSCVCMKPSFLPLDMFDLAVVPAHDNPPDKPNIFVTLAAPNRVTPELLESESQNWSNEFPPDERNVISWIVGGPSSSVKFEGNHVLKGIESTLAWASDNGWSVWLSTARRTPIELENEIENLGEKYKSLTWTLLWHRDNRNPLYGMFHRSKIAIVTSDSVSMIAEAASAGKGPIVFQSSDHSKSSGSKHDRMVDGLIEAGYGLRVESPDEISSTLDNILSDDVEFPMLEDTRKAAERLLAIFEINTNQ